MITPSCLDKYNLECANFLRTLGFEFVEESSQEDEQDEEDEHFTFENLNVNMPDEYAIHKINDWTFILDEDPENVDLIAIASCKNVIYELSLADFCFNYHFEVEYPKNITETIEWRDLQYMHWLESHFLKLIIAPFRDFCKQQIADIPVNKYQMKLF